MIAAWVLAAFGFVLAGERIQFADGKPVFTPNQVKQSEESTRRGFAKWAANKQGRMLVRKFDRRDYQIFVIEDSVEEGMGRAPQPAIATMAASGDPKRLKVYHIILNPAFAKVPDGGFRVFEREPHTADELMTAAWAGEMLHVDFYSQGIVLPHHERADFQRQWQDIATQLGFPTLRHDDRTR